MKAFIPITPKLSSLHFSLYEFTGGTITPSFNHPLSILFIHSGSGHARLNDISFDFLGPSIICLNEQECLTLINSKHLSCTVLSFHPSMIREYFTLDNIKHLDHGFTPNDIGLVIYLSIFFQRFPNYFGFIPTSEPLMKQFDKFLRDLINYSHTSICISDVLIQILASIKRIVQSHLLLENVILTETGFEVKDVLMYLHTHYKSKITIPKLSQQFHINRTTLSDHFFQATGETIITYLNKYRIHLAGIMLRESNHSISYIAHEVGFNDTAYFAKFFKKYMLHSPSSYRQHFVSLCQAHKADVSE